MNRSIFVENPSKIESSGTNIYATNTTVQIDSSIFVDNGRLLKVEELSHNVVAQILSTTTVSGGG